MLDVHILGTASAMPAHGRMPSAHLLEHNGRGFLLDCGEATQLALLRKRGGLSRLDAIFITHLHGDHIFGLPGLLSSLHLQGLLRGQVLLGPVGLVDYLRACFMGTAGQLLAQLTISELRAQDFGQVVYENKHLRVTALQLIHRVPCFGYLFQEKPKPRQFLPERAAALQVPSNYYRLLKLENTITLPDGRSIHPDQVLGNAPPGVSYAFCSDTAYHPPLAEQVQAVDCLYHEATFPHAFLKRAQETGHSTASQAGQIAQAAGVRSLLLGHYSARFPDPQPLLDEARAVFPQAHLAREGQVWRILPNTPLHLLVSPVPT